MRGPGLFVFGRRDLAVAGYSFSLLSGPTLPADSFRRMDGRLCEALSRAGTFRHFRPRLSCPG
jgi:hypothetical protein